MFCFLVEKAASIRVTATSVIWQRWLEQSLFTPTPSESCTSLDDVLVCVLAKDNATPVLQLQTWPPQFGSIALALCDGRPASRTSSLDTTPWGLLPAFDIFRFLQSRAAKSVFGCKWPAASEGFIYMQKSCGTWLRQPCVIWLIGSNCCSVTVLVSLSSFITVRCNWIFLSRNAQCGVTRVAVRVRHSVAWRGCQSICQWCNRTKWNLSVLVAGVMVVFKTAILLSWSLLGR